MKDMIAIILTSLVILISIFFCIYIVISIREEKKFWEVETEYFRNLSKRDNNDKDLQ